MFDSASSLTDSWLYSNNYTNLILTSTYSTEINTVANFHCSNLHRKILQDGDLNSTLHKSAT